MTIDRFIEELKKINIEINSKQLDQLEKYYNLLIEWNNKINLTGITKKEDVYLKHFYDSLTLNKIIDLYSIDSLCDIGTGAGFPGLVIKILFPNIKVTLVDSLAKRITFLHNVIDELNLDKIELVVARAEEYAKENREKYDVVTARAVASLPILLEYSLPLVKVQGFFVAMKADITEELEHTKNYEKKLLMELIKKEEFYLPIEDSKRTLIKYMKIAPTPMLYPRKYSEMKKKNL